MKMKTIADFSQIIEVPSEGACAGEGDCEFLPEAMNDRVEKVLITRALIKHRVNALADEIARYYRDRGEKILNLVFILEGARTFATDLEKAIFDVRGPEIQSYSLKAQTYGSGIKDEGETSRAAKIIHAPAGLEGKRVLLVEDIIDQGFTLYAVRRWLLEKALVSEVKTCALVEKNLRNPSENVRQLRQQLALDWTGFRIPDRWVAGYGIDAGQDFRFLPFIVVVREDYYRQRG